VSRRVQPGQSQLFWAGPCFSRDPQYAYAAGADRLRRHAAAVHRRAGASALPIIGINKQRNPRWPVYITPTVAAARPVVRAGAAIVAVDATHRPRKGDASPEALMAALKKELRCLVMADIDSVDEGIAAA
jgi:putative N-acetylmannosamine-6-phosphate epimerase